MAQHLRFRDAHELRMEGKTRVIRLALTDQSQLDTPSFTAMSDRMVQELDKREILDWLKQSEIDLRDLEISSIIRPDDYSIEWTLWASLSNEQKIAYKLRFSGLDVDNIKV